MPHSSYYYQAVESVSETEFEETIKRISSIASPDTDPEKSKYA